MPEEVLVNKIIKKGYFVEPIFGSMYTFSPYMGCSHACIYCDGRAEKYHFEGDFVNDVKVRTNVPDIFYKELNSLREVAPIHLSSGISDVYQKVEAKYNITGRCSEILAESPFPASVLTKSSLIKRDRDNWFKVNKKGGFTLQISFTTLDDTVRKRFEPGASTVEERLEIIQDFKNEGCSVGIYMMPLLPQITDSVKSIEKVLIKLQDIGVDYIMPGLLTLRPGRQKDLYMDIIKSLYPEYINYYRNLYRENRESGSPIKTYIDNYEDIISSTFKNINSYMPHKKYINTMPLYCEIHLLLTHMISLYTYRGIDVSRLQNSIKKLRKFLSEEKKSFNRTRSRSASSIDESLKFLILTGELESLIGNKKLAQFISHVVMNRKVFNYNTLNFNGRNPLLPSESKKQNRTCYYER